MQKHGQYTFKWTRRTRRLLSLCCRLRGRSSLHHLGRASRRTPRPYIPPCTRRRVPRSTLHDRHTAARSGRSSDTLGKDNRHRRSPKHRRTFQRRKHHARCSYSGTSAVCSRRRGDRLLRRPSARGDRLGRERSSSRVRSDTRRSRKSRVHRSRGCRRV